MYSSFSWALQVEASQYLFVWIVIKETGINAPSSASVLEIPGTSSRSDRSSILSCHLIKKMPLSVFSVMLWKTGRNVMLALYLCHKSTFSFCSILRRLVFATLANEFCIVMITECQTSFTFNSSDGISWLSSILSRPEKHVLECSDVLALTLWVTHKNVKLFSWKKLEGKLEFRKLSCTEKSCGTSVMISCGEQRCHNEV